MITELHTNRLDLRQMKETDAADLFQVWSDPEVARFMNISPFTAEQQAVEMIRMLADLAQKKQAIRFSIMEKESGTIMGSCGYNYFDFEQARAEIGYDLARAYWGKGYAAEAVSALLDRGFNSLGLNRLEAKVDPRNVNSIRLLEKLGFTREGLLRAYEREETGAEAGTGSGSGGIFNDLYMYSRLASD
ncbi:GNAT family N-acetyltransferase [Paenibacillus barcinonensis]|uniref:GNAT family N-acetyltransferase n=1 Tax=Paenibacillus barcinonensis TaxID=198119 RepID=A0A2V4VQ17_PAEBA|nr:GNAT family N-acetyltransferase [Paenibacillus barcinonensis]PYE48313.1 ribosomal-protein-alanine N-acetyltransferase [Paenibacillus barcinonensis]QKS56848.1 GNAT family N-acetyltransferase [Paenibacillus barcinonensis]